MPRRLALANSPVYNSFKFVNSSEVVVRPKGNKRISTQSRMQKQDNSVTEKEVADGLSSEYRELSNEHSASFVEPRRRTKIYIKKSFVDFSVPEMVAFYQDSNHNFIDFILAERDDYLCEDCESSSGSPEDNVDAVSSNSDKLKVVDHEAYSEKDASIVPSSLEKIIHRPMQVQRKEPGFERVEECETGRIEAFISRPEVNSMSSGIRSHKASNSRRAEWSGPISDCGSSNASSSSFTFPALQAEWIGSPVSMPKNGKSERSESTVKMPTSDRRRWFQRHKHWKMNCFCCKS